jgi:ABC-type antimicrobial peptide transport system permease subunit
MVWRGLWHRRTRSLLTVLGVSIGVAAVVALGAMAEGLAEGYGSTASSADLLVMQADAYDVTLSAVDEEVGQDIAQLEGVRDVSGVVIGIAQLEGIPYFLVSGHDPHSASIRHYRVVLGESLSRDKQILMGRQAAGNLKKTVGDSIKLFGVSFRVTGIFETGQLFEDSGAAISLEDAQSVFRMSNRVTYFEVGLYDPTEADSVKSRIERLSRDVSVTKAADIADEQQTVQMFRAMAWGISLIAVLIGGLGMMNTMVMAVFEQTREIGVLRALGWRRRRVLGLILSQSLALSLLGGLLGVGIGLGLVWVVNRTPAISSMAPATVRGELLIQGVSVALVLGLVGGLYPAWRAAGLSPVEALRYDTGLGAGKEPAWTRFLGIAFRGLWRRRTRSLLTLAGIAVGAGLIVSLGAITEGSVQEFTALASQGGAELVAVQADVADMGYSVIEERIGRAIAAMPGVQYVSGIIWGVSAGEDMPFLFIMGVDPNDKAIMHYRLVEGERIRGRREVMLGQTAAENLKKSIGETLILPGGIYRIVGIFETGLAYEDASGVIALREAQRAFHKRRQVSMYQIKLRDPSEAEAIRDTIETQMGKDVSVSMSATFVEDRADFQNSLAMMNAVFALAILVGGVVVTNTMIMSVMERTREIGTLRALGWPKVRVIWMVLSEALLLGLIASGIGIVGGVGMTLGLQAIPGVGMFVKAIYTPQIVGQAVVISVLLGLVGGMYPAWHASRLRPVEALQYE